MVEVLLVTLWLAQDLEAQLEAAKHAEMVDGDLKKAAEEYGAIVDRAGMNRPGANRAVAAKALLQLAECQERLGQRVAARASYKRVISEFGDQAEMAARAKAKLGAWTWGQAGPRNLDFERGREGWMVQGGAVQMRREGCRNMVGCAVLAGPGRLTQSFSAEGYRGKTVRLSAWLHVELRGDAGAQLVLDGQKVTADGTQWTRSEVVSEIGGDAQAIQIGVATTGKGRVWIDGVSFQLIGEAEIHADRVSLQKLYGRLDPAYLQPDLERIAQLAAADAQYRDAELKEPLRRATSKWTAELARRTTVTSIELAGNGAIVNVHAEYVRSEANHTRSVSYVDTRRDTWVRVGAEWKLKEYRVLATRQIDSTTDAQTAKLAAADLKRTAAPLATIEVGHTFYDLAPFGMAVGDARIVALGEATFGMREFFEIKHRLLEYLVKEKGFSVFAIKANWPEANTLDLYIKSGEGDPKALLTGMLWPWNTAEALDVVEWMRDFNKAPGPHATLSLAGFGIAPASVVIPQVVDYLKRYAPADADTAQADYAALLEMESRLGEVYDDGARKAAEQAENVVKLLDAKRDALVQASSMSEWRNARQAAEMARQNAATRIAGKGSGYLNEMMARNIEWLADEAFPGEKMVVWGHNELVGFAPGDPDKSVGTWLREEFGERVYVTGFAFHRGDLLAIGVRNGMYEGVAKQTIPESAEDNGDSVLSAAGMPVFFLDLHTPGPTSALGRWLAESHSFLEVGELWNRDDPQSNSRVEALAKSYDGLVFLEEGHAAHGL